MFNLRELSSLKWPIEIRQLAEFFISKGMRPPEARELIFQLMGLEALEVSEDNPDFERSKVTLITARIPDAIEALPQEIKKVKPLRAKEIPESYLIAATLHSSLKHSLDSLNIQKIRDSISGIISSCKSELLICSPFLDRGGVQYLEKAFIRAANKKVSVKLITRIDDLDNPSLSQILGLYDLISLFGKNISIYNYSYMAEGSKGRRNVVEALHAKLIISGAKEVYIGSAEIRLNALCNNFEVGVFIKSANKARTLARLFDAIWEKSTEIEHGYIISKCK